MKYCLTLVAAILASTAFSASASEHDIVVGLGESCPRGYISKSLSYRWDDGRFVRDGRVCESLHGKN
jgi:hypothetical protein